MDNTVKKSVKKHIKFQESEIRKFVAEFDPLGIGEGFPEDEYDDLVHHIISVLNRKDYNLKDKKELLTDKILRYADLSIKYKEEVLGTVRKILQWWQDNNLI